MTSVIQPSYTRSGLLNMCRLRWFCHLVSLFECIHVQIGCLNTAFHKFGRHNRWTGHQTDAACLPSDAVSIITRSPAVARDGRPYWPSRKTVILSGIGLAAVLGVGHCPDWLSWSFIAYRPSTLNTLPATLAVIKNACLLTCDMSRTNSDQHPQFICSHKDAGYYNFGRRLSCYVMQTNKHLQFI